MPRLEFHYTPKHASWLNMVEIEIGVMVNECLDRRIPDKARIKWLFTVDRARERMRRVYPGEADRPEEAAA